MSETLASLADFDQVSAAEQPFEFALKRPDGSPSNVYLSILGDDAEKVQKFTTRRVNEDRRQQVLRAKSRKHDEYTPIEDDINFAIEACVVRTVGWRGMKEPFSPENARKLFTTSRDARAQVLEESAKAANFMQRKD